METPETEGSDEFLESYGLLLEKIKSDYQKNRSDLDKLYKLHLKQVRNADKIRRKKRGKTGFTKPAAVPDNLAKFLKIPIGTVLSRTEITKQIYSELRKRKLYYEKDERVLRADEEIKILFNLPESVNTSTNPKDKTGFNFYNLQKYIAVCYKNKTNNNQIEDSDPEIEDSEEKPKFKKPAKNKNLIVNLNG